MKPQANVCVIVVCADTDEEAERLAASTDLRILQIGKGERTELLSPEEAQRYPYTSWELERIRENRNRMVVGNPEKVKSQLAAFSEDYGVEEMIILTSTHDFQARVRSYELLAKAFDLRGIT
jgi:alkanesulfonate monooxygenase SsuD/methylene tetrahydromethanopterin reductase-like flavin-dependent oxidoreductase (luciferase family)